MKRLLFFTFSVILLLVGFGCSKDSDTIQIPKQDSPVESYVAIDWEKTKIASMDLKNGEIILNCNGEIPDFINGRSIIVLETDTSSHIRRVMNASENGSTITLQTSQANMSELFVNSEFTFSLSPSTERFFTKSGVESSIDAKGFIHPVRIMEKTADGMFKSVYDIQDKIMTRTETTNKYGVLLQFDNSGETIYENNNFLLTWEKNVLEIALEGTFHFKFGEAVKEKEILPNLKVKVSDLEEFYFKFVGAAKQDLMLGATINGEFSIKEKGRIVRKDIITERSYKFVTPNGILVYVTVQADLKNDFEINGKAKAHLNGGISLKGKLEAGMQYNKDRGWEAISEASFDYQVKPANLDTEMELNAYVNIYPEINILLYDFLGPTIQLKPFLKDTAQKASFKTFGTSEGEFYGFRDRSYAGFAIDSWINLHFFGNEDKVFLPEFLREVKVEDTPTKIQLISPSVNEKITPNIPFTLTFKVLRHSLGLDLSAQDIYVKFTTDLGFLDRVFDKTDTSGNVNVVWTPLGSNSCITAEIYDGKGEVINFVTYPEKKNEEFSIVGRWRGPDMIMTSEEDRSPPLKTIYTFYGNGTYTRMDNVDKIGFNMDGSYLIYWTEQQGSYSYNKTTRKLTSICEQWLVYTIQNGVEQPVQSQDTYIGTDFIGGTIVLVSNTEFHILAKDGSDGYTVFTKLPD